MSINPEDYIEHVAHRLLGEPNKALTTNSQLRFGTHGSIAVEIAGDKRGTWYDHEHQIGGGVIDLINYKAGLTEYEAWQWLRGEVGAPTEERREIVATYDYLNAEGQLSYQVVRYAPKTFKQRRPDGKGGWTWNIKGLRLLPYRLPEVLKAGDRTIFIVEGEKDANALRQLGLIATCNSGGAAEPVRGKPYRSKWPSHFSEYFVDKDVVILPDNDAAGRAHVLSIAANICAVARQVRIVELPGLPDKGDPSDWIAGGGTAGALRERVSRTSPYVASEQTHDSSNMPDWYSQCITGAKDQVLSIHANVLRALRCDPAWQGVFGYDQMREEVMLLRPVPEHGQPVGEPFPEPRPWMDFDDAATQEWMQIAGLPHVGRDTAANAISQRARELTYHPVRDWLESLEWDGVPRIQGGTTNEGEIIEPWATGYLGAENNPYTTAVGKMWLTSAAARVLEPGCKVDHMPILEGEQDSGKSTAVMILCGEKHFSDGLHDIRSKDAMAHLAGKWIIEIAELDAMSRAEDTAMKAFMTRRIDKFRPVYGRRQVERRRQCVFIGTTNKTAYLKDETGGRRYWPMKTGVIDLDALRRDRNQLWAEAVHLYKQGHQWHITDPDLLKLAREQQAERYDEDVWEETVADYLHGKTAVTVGKVMQEALNIDKPQQNRAGQNRVMKILTRLGWIRGERCAGGRKWNRSSEQ